VAAVFNLLLFNLLLLLFLNYYYVSHYCEGMIMNVEWKILRQVLNCSFWLVFMKVCVTDFSELKIAQQIEK